MKRIEGRKKIYLFISLVLLMLLSVVGTKLIIKKQIDISNGIDMHESYGASVSILPNKNYQDKNLIPQASVDEGTKIDEYKGIAVYSNGTNYMSSHGLNFSDSGYYYGYKWQCVEFVKRFYYEVYNHQMPDGAGNAKYFFNPMLGQGEFNEQRGLIQYCNGGNVKPQLD
ncbi:MAG: CHAP domain-containing protein, partial [Eubacteriales bacterium]